MIEETKNGYEVPVPGATAFIPARTYIEAEGIVMGLQGATTKSNPYPLDSAQYWRWESGRYKAAMHLEAQPSAMPPMRRYQVLVIALAVISAAFFILAIASALGVLSSGGA